VVEDRASSLTRTSMRLIVMKKSSEAGMRHFR